MSVDNQYIEPPTAAGFGITVDEALARASLHGHRIAPANAGGAL